MKAIMDEYTIVEVTETPERSLGDGFPRRTTQMEKVKEDETEDGDGPWKEVDVVKRQKQTLDSGYLTDLTITVRNTKFRCHKIILSFSSPKLAKMISENPDTLQLQNMDPGHFRFLLEIIYGGEADKLNNAKDALGVARAAHELQIYTAIAYCTKILRKLLDPSSVSEIMEFACRNNDEDFKNSCMKVRNLVDRSI
ncbi:hypothetical protein B566_EDAN016093 [Ephemera danica]|nr:hypothetical protein B566_EDAN016093 [Ephemera danica]